MVSNIKKIQNAQFKVWDFFNYSSTQFSKFSAKGLLKTITYLTLIYALNIYSTTQAFATNYHISVSGRPSGDGSKGNPWDIVTALSGEKGAPGDTLWLHGGVYKGAFVSKLSGSSSANIVLAQFPGETAILDGVGQGRSTITLNIYGKYTTYYGFQVMNSSSRRYSSQSGGNPSDLEISTGIHVDGPNNKLINLIVRDNVGVGIGFWKAAVNSELYGNIIYNNGWQGADRGHGPGIYAQNENTIKNIKDNIIFGGFGRGIQIYGVNGGLTGFNIDGNTFFNNGQLSAGTTAIIIGGESAADNITIKNNNTYKNATGLASKGFNIQVHYGNVTNGRLVIDNNNIVGGDLMLSIKDWKQIAFNNNNIVGKNGIITFSVPSGVLGSYSWNNNSYHTSNTTNSMDGLTFDTWKRSYGFDGSSRFSTSAPNNEVIIKPNYYKRGTGTVVVYNHQKLSSIDVDISRIIPNGAEYEILDVENVTGQAIITGKYSGGTVRLPMNLTTTARPNGVSSVPHTDQGFNVFLVRTKGNVTSSPVVATNKVPTLNAIASPAAINEDAGEQTISISGISSGGESQTLRVTATSDNTSLIPTPSVLYSSPNSSGSIKFRPAANKSGTANITVTVNDGASSNNSVSKTFKVTVNPVNDAPTLSAISNVSVAANSSAKTVSLAGISAGPSESQTLTVSATSSNTGLIPNPSVVYSSPGATGTLKFTPVSNKSGTATITVKVTDNGSGTAPNVNSYTRTFTVTVAPVSTPVNKQPTLNAITTPAAINEDAPEQTINLGGISAGDGETQKVTVTATSDNTGLIANPSVQYTSPNKTGSIKFKPAINKSGTANITVTVNDGSSSNNTISRTFKVSVNPVNDAPTLNSIGNISVAGNSSAKTVNLAGISAGPNESQPLSVTATSSNTGLISNPIVTYSSPGTTGSLKFTPATNKSGTATITVKVSDNGSGTAPHKNFVTKSFTVTVGAVLNTNVATPPSIDDINNIEEVFVNSSVQTVSLNGITAGSGDNKTIQVSATSSNTTIIPNPVIEYSAPNNKGFLKFKPASNKTGSVTISVKVKNGNSTKNLTTKTFKINVVPSNIGKDDNNNNNVAKVERLNLINAINNKVLFELTDGMTIYTSKLPVKLYQLNIDAVVKDGFKGSVMFGFDRNQRYKVENLFPFAIGGDERGSKFRKWSGLKPGKHTITATTYSKTKAEGDKGTTKKITVTVIDDYKEIGSPFGDIISLHLINAKNNNIIFELKDGMTIEVSDLPMALNQLNIRGISSTDNTGSVVFGFNGNLRYNIENVSPYVIGSNSGTDYFLWGDGLKMGVNTVIATTYKEKNGLGKAGKPYKISFTIVNSKALTASSKVTSSTEMSEPDQFKVLLSKFYPNPVQDQLTIQLLAPEDDVAKIYLNDVSGQLVKSYTSEIIKGENDLNIDTSEADSGVYIVTIVSTRNKINFKIIKD